MMMLIYAEQCSKIKNYRESRLNQRIKYGSLVAAIAISLSVHLLILANASISDLNTLAYPKRASTLVVTMIGAPAIKIPPIESVDEQVSLPLPAPSVEKRVLSSEKSQRRVDLQGTTVTKIQNSNVIKQKRKSQLPTPLPAGHNSMSSGAQSVINLQRPIEVSPSMPLVTEPKKAVTQQADRIKTPGAATLIARSIAAVRDDPNLGAKPEEDFARYQLNKRLESIKHLLPAVTDYSRTPQLGDIEEFRTALGDMIFTVHLGKGKKLCAELSSKDYSTLDIAENPPVWKLFAC